jgi:H/ACA ribonucleoprotein complex subunit 3
MTGMRKCPACATYTLKEKCPACGAPSANPHPAKFSPKDPYGKYRRMMKSEAEGANATEGPAPIGREGAEGKEKEKELK